MFFEAISTSAIHRIRRLPGVAPVFQRLQALCPNDDEFRFLAHCLAFLLTRETRANLLDWAEDSEYAGALAQFCQRAFDEFNGPPELIQDKDAQTIKARFKRDNLVPQYVAAGLGGSRLLGKSDEVAGWTERLRLFLLIKSFEALDDGFPAEAHLLTAFRTVRDACDVPEGRDADLLAKLACTSYSLNGFCQRLYLGADVALEEQFGGSAAAPFFRAARHLAEGGSWALPPSKQGAAGVGTPLVPLPAMVSARRLQPSSDSQSDASADDPDGEHSDRRVPVNPTSSGHEQRRAARALRLEGIERHLYLGGAWYQLTPAELRQGAKHLSDLLLGGTEHDRLGAAVVAVATLTGASIYDVQYMPVNGSSGQGWWLDGAAGRLRRIPPRFPRRWRAPEALDGEPFFVRPLADAWEIQLPAAVANVFLGWAGAPAGTKLGELWKESQPVTLPDWFQHVVIEPALPRLAGPATEHVLDHFCFAQTGDHVLTRLVRADDRSALPAAAAYSSYASDEIRRPLRKLCRLAGAKLLLPTPTPRLNAAGSELDLDIRRARDLITAHIQAVETASGPQTAAGCVGFHNQLVGLVAHALYASTGARPVDSPFEFLWMQDRPRGLLLVSDKEAGGSQGARAVILSAFAADLLERVYLPHLESLALALEQGAPKFAAKLKSLLAGERAPGIPLLFLLELEPAMVWRELTPTEFGRLAGLQDALPENCYRHLHATWLRRAGLHPDIRDALLGHGEHPAEPFGCFSVRIPAQDLETARPLVNRLQDELGFVLPRLAPSALAPLGALANDEKLSPARLFGAAKRAARRQETQELAEAEATRDINRFLNGRTVDLLSTEELDRLARAMLFRADNIPHRQANLRYAKFEAFVREEWDQNQRHAALSKRYSPRQASEEWFHPDALLASERLHRLASAFEACPATSATGEPRPTLAACMASLDILLYSHLANPLPLRALVQMRYEELGLVKLDGRFWLEWGLGAPLSDGHSTFRLEISARAAYWASIALACQRQSSAPPDLPIALSPLAEVFPYATATMGELLDQACEWAAARNRMLRPGFEAAHLEGKIVGSGLPHCDWVRLVRGGAPEVDLQEYADETVSAPSAIDGVDKLPRARLIAEAATDPAHIRCQRMCESISTLLLDDGADLRDLKQELSGHPARFGFGFGDAPEALVQFMLHLLVRKPKRGSKDNLRLPTVRRYWYSLSWPVTETMADKSMLSADEDELTEWYGELLNCWASAPRRKTSGGAKAAQDADAKARTHARLKEWHQYMESRYGLSTPDWSELAVLGKYPAGRPGLTLHREYLAALNQLLGGLDPMLAPPRALESSFLILCANRFGLRSKECIGLRRCDWVEGHGLLVVLVQHHRKRPLKTMSGRRQVPLIGTFDPLERAVVNEVLRRWELQCDGRRKAMLLQAARDQGVEAAQSQLAGPALAGMKQVTGNPRATIHQLRHSFAARVASNVLGARLDPDPGAPWSDPASLRSLLVNRSELDRRTMWGVGRILGHKTPETLMNVYWNCLHHWQVFQPSRAHEHRVWSELPMRLTNLDSVHLDRDYLERSWATEVDSLAPACPLVAGLQFLKLVGQRIHESKARQDALLSEEQVTKLNSTLLAAADRLAHEPKLFGAFRILDKIPPARMRALIHQAALRSPFLREVHPEASTARLSWTVGRSGQILLFKEHHFEVFGRFIEALGLTSDDVWLVRSDKTAEKFDAVARRVGLGAFLKPVDSPGKTFQLDVAIFEDDARMPLRMAAICAPTGRFSQNLELSLLWCCWRSL